MEEQNEHFEEESTSTENPCVQEQQRIAELEEQLQAKQEENLRLLAEFDNFRKRTARERIELTRSAGQDVIKDFLPVLDDLERAMQNMNAADDIDALREGVDLIESKLRKTLSARGLSEMDVLGEDFDPEHHEAVTKMPAPSEDQVGKVIDQLEKGYKLNDKIIRYPKVVVGA